jgi:hypothetical protein
VFRRFAGNLSRLVKIWKDAGPFTCGDVSNHESKKDTKKDFNTDSKPTERKKRNGKNRKINGNRRLVP